MGHSKKKAKKKAEKAAELQAQEQRESEQSLDQLGRVLSSLEERLSRLEEDRQTRNPPEADTPAADFGDDAVAPGSQDSPEARQAATSTSNLWLLEQLKSLYPNDDVVIYGGTANPAGTGTVAWQYGRPAEFIQNMDWRTAAGSLSGLSHPIRLELLQAMLGGVTATSELAELPDVGTTGQIYHHLNHLQSSGWITQTKRGHWAVAPNRVIPLLTVIMASQPG